MRHLTIASTLVALVATVSACDDALPSAAFDVGSDAAASDAGLDATSGDAATGDTTNGDDTSDAGPSGDTSSVADVNLDDVSFGDVESDTPPSALPRPGLWTYVDEGIRDNTCGEYAFGDDDQRFWIRASEGDRFVIAQSEPWGDIACRVAADRFVCPERGTGEVPIEDTDAVLTYVVAVSGTLDGDAALQGEQRVTVTCEGASCAFAPAVLGISFPCGWSAAFSATSP